VDDPQAWGAYREGWNGNSVRAPREALQAALAGCRTCPILDWCSTQESAAGMVQAGTIYGEDGTPVPLDRFAPPPSQNGAAA
jgi:hypothetical protein